MLNIKPELIAPAGDLQKLKIAFQYGADAVYASTPKFSMRTREIGFNYDSLKEGITYTHELGKKIYLTVNVFPHSTQIDEFKEHCQMVASLKPDGIIVADPGAIAYLKEITEIPLHLSTQANTVNYLDVNFWAKIGLSRVVLARELSLEDIKLITEKGGLPVECFVHGAMCMAYSGRCQISNYMLGRDPNQGECAQPCRYKYKFGTVKEEMRETEDYPVYEDDNGFYIFNSKDLCMIEYIPELISAGISSFKLEGRLKSIYYLGCVVKAYREAIDLYFEDTYKYNERKISLLDDVKKLAHRGYTTGFYFQKPNTETNNYLTSKAQAHWGFIGIVTESTANTAKITVKNRLVLGDKIEIVTPNQILDYKLSEMLGKDGPLEEAHAGYQIEIKTPSELPINSFLRKSLESTNNSKDSIN